MANTLADNQQDAEKQTQISVSRTYEAEEFEADTEEKRTVALLAERRRSHHGASNSSLEIASALTLPSISVQL